MFFTFLNNHSRTGVGSFNSFSQFSLSMDNQARLLNLALWYCRHRGSFNVGRKVERLRSALSEDIGITVIK